MSDRTPPGIRPASAEGRKPRWWIVWVGLGAGIVVLAILISSLSSNGSDYDSNNEYEAIAQCEAAIEERLKSPSTASFDSSATGSGTWTVTGTVDAENSFGATVRSSFECSVIIEGDTARTKIVYLE